MSAAADSVHDDRGPAPAGAAVPEQSTAAPPPAHDLAERSEHLVQFYRDEQVLVGSVCDYLRQALHGGAAAVVIATGRHIAALQDRWRCSLPEAQTAITGGRLIVMDAEQTLQTFMVDQVPDRERLFASVGDVLSEALRRHGRVAVFGEMVAELWKAGRTAAAVQLEQLWNELMRRWPLTLMCAYPIQACAEDHHIAPFEAVCAAHTRVVPVESFILDVPEQGNLVAQLQQKALALEKTLEQEAARKERLAHFAAIVASSDDAIVSKTLDGLIKSWNAGAERIFGWSAEEALGRSITLIIPPERLEEEWQILETLKRGERIDHFETVRLAKDGRHVDVSLTVSPVRNAAGEVIGASKIARDITARKHGEAWLTRQKEAFQAAINGAPLDVSLGKLIDAVLEQTDGQVRCALYLADAQGQRLHHVAGISEIYAGLDDGFRIGPDALACGLAAHCGQPVITADVAQEPRWRQSLRLAEKLGFRACWSFPIGTAGGRILGTFAVYHAQPRQPQLGECELAATLTHSAAIIISQHQEAEDRARAHAALRENEARLRAADQQKDQFLALLGHELRNPLAPIRNASELLARMLKGDTRAQVAIDIVRRQSAQLMRLVDDLLDVGRITQGRVQLRWQDLDLVGVVAQAVETVEPLIRDKHHELSITTSYEPLYVRGDFGRLVQCVVNLLTNAAKYTDPHGKIRLETRREASSAIIAVADNGAGIPGELLPQVFELFVQSDRTLDRSQGGLGVGLSIVKRLINMHGGEIAAYSPGVGRGSTFEIRVPLLLQPRAGSRQEDTFRAKPQRVLIADDNVDAANSLAMLLSFSGHETQVVHSASEVLARIETLRPDAALLDIALPQVDGYELAKRLRAIPELRGMRLIALTGYAQPEDQQRAASSGFDAHLVKPVDLAALERALAAAPGAAG